MTSLQLVRVALGTITALVLGTVASAAQTPALADVARQEQERRKAVPPAVKVLTNKDLPKVTAPPVAAAADPAKPDAGAAPAQAAAPAPAPAMDEASWRARITEPREQLRRDEILLLALQSRINTLTADDVARNDPYQRARTGVDLQKAIVEMERVRTEVAGLTKKIDDIEEDARKASVPPGWLR